ncbi:ABC transporter ATP-binding protein, partial [Aeromicrobium sp. PE09-221]|uniref:ABC transporter ATP-binding protein n=1 Tax=Aeromicrobium sp. PE09-221 TaxID=1898043 RepID=UPI000B3E81A0
MVPLLEVNDLQVAFRARGGEVQAVRAVHFTIGKGETVAIVGESGCGKSVTAQSIMRLLATPPAVIQNGSIHFKGTDLLTLTNRQMERIRGREIAMIFQDPMTSLHPTLSVGTQMTEVMTRHLNVSKRAARLRAKELLHFVGIPNPDTRLKQYPHEFSGGMRQRVMIAMALACHPSLLIADEPTTALDVTIQAQILQLLKEIQQQMGMSILLITHDLGVVADLCDRVVVMYAGKVVEIGTKFELFHHPRHPYTRGLLAAVPRLNQPKNEPLIPIEGTPPDLIAPPAGCGFYSRCSEAMRVCERQDAEETRLTDTHQARCWQLHPLAAGRDNDTKQEQPLKAHE